MTLVSVFMDVEDPINPLADEAALDIARLFTNAGVRGSFCVTGEKCRTLVRRGRSDILEAFKPHCLGLHTDTHSQHPTTMELLAEPDYDQGCRLALEAESRGLESFERAFGRRPAFWGGAGNTWSAEVCFALRELGIPAYSYALTGFPGEPVHRFNGAMALPQHFSVSEIEWRNDELAQAASKRVIQAIGQSKLPWVSVFTGHPTKLRHVDYWDTPYFRGRTPPKPELTEPVPAEDYERGKANLSAFLNKLNGSHEVVGVDAIVSLPWCFRPPTPDEAVFFETATALAIRGAARWPVHREGLDPENMVGKALDLAHTAEIATLPG